MKSFHASQQLICKKLFEDKVSGTRTDRPGLIKTMEILREGDTLVVWKLDQLGRKGGRKRQMTDSKFESAKKLLADGIQPRDVAQNLGASIPTLYRLVPASAQQ